MKSEGHLTRVLAVSVVLASLLLAGSNVGCVTHDMLLREAREAVASHVGARDVALAKLLAPTLNTKGEGVLVFVRSDLDCGPKYSWIWLGESSIYAVDKASQALTPDWPTIAEASEAVQHGIGFSRNADVDAQQIICEVPSH